jgi:hypothetical protein
MIISALRASFFSCEGRDPRPDGRGYYIPALRAFATFIAMEFVDGIRLASRLLNASSQCT